VLINTTKILNKIGIFIFIKERVCEDSASAEISTNEIASMMDEIDYIIEEMKNHSENSSCYNDNNEFGHSKDSDSNEDPFPATIDELKDIKSNFCYCYW
jgi:hypothetical protein